MKVDVRVPVHWSSVCEGEERSDSVALGSEKERPRVPRLIRCGFSRSQAERSGWDSLGML